MIQQSQRKFRIFLRVSFLVISVGVIFGLLYLGIVPGGEITYDYSFKGRNEFISKIFPTERVSIASSTGNIQIIGDPVYFSLRTPRRFDNAVLKLKYRHMSDDNALANKWNCPLIETGVLVDKNIWRYDLKPIENKIFDSISLAWNTQRDGNTVLLQKNLLYKDIDSFLSSTTTDLKKVALYNYTLNKEYLLPDYASSSSEQEINYALRGAYQFFTYLDDEDLDFEFEFEDINKNKDEDRIDVQLYYNNSLIDVRHLGDDGVLSDNGETTDSRLINFQLANLPTGVYKIEVRVNDDIVTKKITTKQKKISFINNIRLYDDENEGIVMFTDSKKLQAKTVQPKSLQKIIIENSEMDLNETYKQFEMQIARNGSSSLAKINIQNDGIFLSGNGVFVFDESTYINPKFKKLDSNIDIVKDDIEYVVANYSSPSLEDGWKSVVIDIDLKKAYRENQKYSFIISIPGLKLNDKISDGIEVSEISVDLKGVSLLDRIKEMIN